MWIKSVGWFCVLVLSGLVALIPQRAAAQDTSTTEEREAVGRDHAQAGEQPVRRQREQARRIGIEAGK